MITDAEDQRPGLEGRGQAGKRSEGPKFGVIRIKSRAGGEEGERGAWKDQGNCVKELGIVQGRWIRGER